jgi:hypothetical protein
VSLLRRRRTPRSGCCDRRGRCNRRSGFGGDDGRRGTNERCGRSGWTAKDEKGGLFGQVDAGKGRFCDADGRSARRPGRAGFELVVRDTVQGGELGPRLVEDGLLGWYQLRRAEGRDKAHSQCVGHGAQNLVVAVLQHDERLLGLVRFRHSEQ